MNAARPHRQMARLVVDEAFRFSSCFLAPSYITTHMHVHACIIITYSNIYTDDWIYAAPFRNACRAAYSSPSMLLRLPMPLLIISFFMFRSIQSGTEFHREWYYFRLSYVADAVCLTSARTPLAQSNNNIDILIQWILFLSLSFFVVRANVHPNVTNNSVYIEETKYTQISNTFMDILYGDHVVWLYFVCIVKEFDRCAFWWCWRSTYSAIDSFWMCNANFISNKMLNWSIK